MDNTEIILLITVFFICSILFSPRIRFYNLWAATITPLASIIGSGFLIAGPLIFVIAGNYALIAIVGIVLIAYGIGEIIRFNITYLEPLLKKASTTHTKINIIENLSSIVLAFAYIISVAFYIRLLASFALHYFIENQLFLENILTTAILLFIGIVGFLRGLHALEHLEIFAVTIKLSIIAALLIGLGIFDLENTHETLANFSLSETSILEKFRNLAGLLLIIQGFETSRYLGQAYSRKQRVRTMRFAQILSGLIYVIFVLLALPLLMHMQKASPDETAIIDLSMLVSPLLPIMLIIAAIMSQFSAAVADTAGAGGLSAEVSQQKISYRHGYMLVIIASIALIWTANIFEIVTLASRAFAFYYLLQGIIALLLASQIQNKNYKHLYLILFSILIVILSFVVIFGLPVE